VNRDLHFDYTTIGHVTIDVLDDGSRRAGGTAFYSALQAARLGLRALIVTRGVPGEIEALLEPYRGELELTVLPAAHTTTLRTLGAGSARSQRLLAWAGAIAAEDVALDTAILHLAPVARETFAFWHKRAPFVGLTPQGLVRVWGERDGEIERSSPSGYVADVTNAVARQCDAIVVNEHERTDCAGLIDAGRTAGANVAVTAGAGPIALLTPGGELLTVDVPPLERPVDDLGAGDVFAAAFFIALSEGRSMLDAAGFANAAAAVRIGGDGAGAIGGREAIEARLRASAGADD
jgi:sugar/nucleoside kinase (ribokinase family)